MSTTEPQTKPLIGQSRSNVGLGSELQDYMRELLTIPALKLAAKKHYEAYEKATCGMSCGKALAEHICSTVTTHKLAFNATMDKLAKIDPSCPGFRL